MAGIPYIRLSPQLDQDVKMDETDDEILGMAFILETNYLFLIFIYLFALRQGCESESAWIHIHFPSGSRWEIIEKNN